jgi:STE24 endopeptidase
MTTAGERDVKRYNRLKLAVSLASTAISFALLLMLLSGGYTLLFEQFAFSLSSQPYIALLIFFGILGVINAMITLPLSYYSGFILEHRYNLSNQTALQWMWERMKGFLVSIPITVPLLLIFYFFLLTFNDNWWLPVGVTLFVVSIGLSRLAPILILPLFYKLTPLNESPLKEKIVSMTRSTTMRVEGIYSFNLSKTTKKANAAFTGIGKSKRLLLGDTLLNNFSEEEIETVFAHELGHYVHRHLWKNILLSTVSIVAGLYVTSLAYAVSLEWFALTSPSQLAALPLLMLWLGLYSLVTSPLGNIVSRAFEFEADRYALERTNNRAAFVSTMNKLAEMNLADRQPHPFIEFLLYSHPSIEKRIAAAERTL